MEQNAPWGQRRDDLRFALLSLVLMKAHGFTHATGREFIVDDFLLNIDAVELPPMADDLEARFSLYVAGQNTKYDVH